MYAYTLLTEVYCQSAAGVKNVVVFYYIHSIILFCLMHVIPAHGLCLLVVDNIYYEIHAEIVLPELSEEPHQPALNYPQ